MREKIVCLHLQPSIRRLNAGVAQLVEHNLAKVRVASSSLVSRSTIPIYPDRDFLFSHHRLRWRPARVVELVDTQDLKSCGHCGCTGSIPVPGTYSKVGEPAGDLLGRPAAHCKFVQSQSPLDKYPTIRLPIARARFAVYVLIFSLFD